MITSVHAVKIHLTLSSLLTCPVVSISQKLMWMIGKCEVNMLDFNFIYLEIITNVVFSRAKIGLDVKEMIERLELSDIAGAKMIYESGWNSEIPDSTGKA